MNHGNNRTVKVDRTQHTKKPRVWGLEQFLVEFEPIGRPQKNKTRWQLL